ncbi:MAG: hypothetical protein ACRC8M_02530 [Cetobacterium sp.]
MTNLDKNLMKYDKDNPNYLPVKDAIKAIVCSKAMFYKLIDEKGQK